jgi:hypothetical protein
MYKDENFNGYGIYTWVDFSLYMGDWVTGRRHGEGVFRSAGGMEYIGTSLSVRRHPQRATFLNIKGQCMYDFIGTSQWHVPIRSYKH